MFKLRAIEKIDAVVSKINLCEYKVASDGILFLLVFVSGFRASYQRIDASLVRESPFAFCEVSRDDLSSREGVGHFFNASTAALISSDFSMFNSSSNNQRCCG